MRIYRDLASGRHEIHYLITADEDDQAMNNDAIRSFIATEFQNAKIIFGKSESKIHAVNRDMDQAPKFDVLVLSSDDMVPVAMGWDEHIASAVLQYFPNLDGAIHYPDGRQKNLCTYSIMGSKLYERFGYIYHPQYLSVFCDNEFHEVCEQWGALRFIDRLIVRHAWEETNDALRRKTNAYFDRDKHVYECRKKAGFPKESVPYNSGF